MRPAVCDRRYKSGGREMGGRCLFAELLPGESGVEPPHFIGHSGLGVGGVVKLDS